MKPPAGPRPVLPARAPARDRQPAKAAAPAAVTPPPTASLQPIPALSSARRIARTPQAGRELQCLADARTVCANQPNSSTVSFSPRDAFLPHHDRVGFAGIAQRSRISREKPIVTASVNWTTSHAAVPASAPVRSAGVIADRAMGAGGPRARRPARGHGLPSRRVARTRPSAVSVTRARTFDQPFAGTAPSRCNSADRGLRGPQPPGTGKALQLGDQRRPARYRSSVLMSSSMLVITVMCAIRYQNDADGSAMDGAIDRASFHGERSCPHHRHHSSFAGASLKAEIASAVGDLPPGSADPKVTTIIVRAVDAADWFAGGGHWQNEPRQLLARRPRQRGHQHRTSRPISPRIRAWALLGPLHQSYAHVDEVKGVRRFGGSPGAPLSPARRAVPRCGGVGSIQRLN